LPALELFETALPRRFAVKNLVLMLSVLGLLTACETMEERQIAGTLGGAALGMAVSGSDDKAVGAVVGGMMGLGAATAMGPNPGNCIFQRPDGSQFEAPCP
jgi:hypothetical protein